MPLKEIFNNSFDIKGDSNNFYLVSEIKNITDTHIIYYLKHAEQYRATAVYFKPFDEKNNVIVPVCYVYDNSDNVFTEENVAEIHKNIWNTGHISIYIVIDTKEIKIFNARKPVSVDEKGIHAVELIEAVEISSKTVKLLKKKQLSSLYLDNGAYNDYYKNDFVETTSPHYILLDRLKKIRTEILKEKELSLFEAFINKLLVIFILLKFIEEKTDNLGKRIVEFDKENIWQGESTFTEILKKKDIITFFEKLANKFNGNIFNFDYTEVEQLKKLSQNHKYLLAGFFDANLEPITWQYKLWKQYSFNYLPIELISGIYEAFLPKDEKTKDIAYTPPYLVNLMIDECMPLNTHSKFFSDEKFKILDPACGSGIFIVTAFRRLVDWKIINDYAKTGKWEVPKVEVLQKILKENIFGVDIKQGAQEIAIFSLQIALCRYLTPVSIWENLRFDNLGDKGKNPYNNIVHKDFFDYFNETQLEGFDLVCGNPPFDKLSKEKYDNYIDKLKIKPEVSIPRYEVAFLFLDIVTNLIKKEGLLSLVLPSKIFYNSTSSNFRTNYITNHSLNKVFDFNNLRDFVLFKEKEISACSVIVQKKQPKENHIIEHYIAKRIQTIEERISFEFDYYDIHNIELTYAINYDFVWKTNLMGGGPLSFFIDYLSKSNSTFENYLKEKRKKNDWVFCEGYQIGGEKDLEKRKYNYIEADYIFRKKTLYAKDFDIDNLVFNIEEYEYLKNPRANDRAIYQKPHLLIRTNIDLQNRFFDFDLCFSENILGIHSPENDKNELIEIEKRFSVLKGLYQAFICATSNLSGVSQRFHSIQIQDIYNLPYPEDITILRKMMEPDHDFRILADDILKYYIQSSRSSSISDLNKTANFNDHLIPFADVFKSVINKVHAKGNLQMRLGNVIETDTLYCMALHFGQNELNIENKTIYKEDLDEELKTLLLSEIGKSYRINRRIQYYTHKNNDDIVYLIKPKQVRYWLRSIALRDTDEMMVDLFKAGF